MAINFIPNDPVVINALPMRQVSPRPNRPGTRAGFNFFDAAAEGLFDPGTPEFLFWQTREAALLAVEVWENVNGNLSRWARSSNTRKLDLLQDAGDDLNAFYDGESLQFFHHTTGTRTTFSGASTDVVAHEAGHAFLDTLRPELFGSTITEQGAFHEAFGDCIALVVGLSDKATRVALLNGSTNLASGNFLEATAEDLSAGVKRALGANHPAAAPRQARNNFKFVLPTTLPTSGPPPVLTREIHSFGRIFSGCFYDTIRNIFNSSTTRNEAALLNATRTAAKLLIAGAKKAPVTTRFFQAVGRAMVLEDQTRNASANRQAITDAFARHSITLGSAAMLAARATLAGAAPRTSGKQRLAAATVKDLRERIGAAPGSKFSFSVVEIGDETVTEAVHQREVPLTGLDSRLKDVVAIAPEPIFIKPEGGMAAIASALPDANTSTDEVHAFVEMLLDHKRIEFDGRSRATSKRRAAKKRTEAVATGDELVDIPTHKIVSRGGKKVLTRVRFTCFEGYDWRS
jgi:hypothetical protein